MDLGIANYYNELALRGLLQIVHFLTFYETIKIEGLSPKSTEIIDHIINISNG